VCRAVLVSDTEPRRATDDHTGPPFCRTGLWQAIRAIGLQEELAGNHPLQMAQRARPARHVEHWLARLHERAAAGRRHARQVLAEWGDGREPGANQAFRLMEDQ
jgi:hypothetical protein